MYFVYLLRCQNNSLYCGYTTDLKRRIHEHLYAKQGAKYTKRYKPIAIAQAWEINASLSIAMRIEYAIKQLSKIEKELLVESTDLALYIDLSTLGACNNTQAIEPKVLKCLWLEIQNQAKIAI